MNLPTITLAEAAEINPRLVTRPTAETLVSFLGMTDLDSESGTTSRGTERNFGDVAKGYTQFADGDILIAKITPCFENGKIARAILHHRHGSGSTEFHVIRPDRSRFDDRFLLRFLRQPYVRAAGERRMTGSGGQRRVPEAYLAELQVPLAPLQVQRQISDTLDKVDALRSKRRNAIALNDRLAQSLFSTTFENIEYNDQRFGRRTLGEVADIRSGITKGRKTPPGHVRTVPYLAVANVQERRLNLATVKEIEASESEIEHHRLIRDDLLLTEGGDPDKLGRGTLWKDEIAECIHQNHIFRVRLRDDSDVEPIFLNWLVASERGRKYFLRSAKQTTGIASINVSQLKAFPLLVPPIELQRLFGQRLAEIERQKAIRLAHLAELDALFASLQHRAFRGEPFNSPA